MKTAIHANDELILIVDDEDALSELLAKILSAEGYRTVKAGSVAQAIDLGSRIRPDLALLDLRLPDGSGVDALRELKRLDGNIQVVILTAHGSPETVRTAMEIGAFDYLTKPFDRDELVDVIQRALASRGALV